MGRYQYDALYRLVLAEGREHAGGNNSTTASDSVRRFWGMPYSNSPGDVRTYTQRYTYDEVGNMLQMRHMAAGGAGNWTRNYTMGTATNRLAGTSIGSDGTGSETYTYDSRGNIISGFNHLYEMVYNAENRLEQVTDAAGIVTCYQYDGSGQRVRKVTDTSGTLRRQRMYIGGWELYRETDPGTGTITTLRQTLNVMDDQTRIAIIDSSAIDSLVRYQYTNHLGTATLEVDEDTNVITYEEYYPYGSTAFTTTQSVMTTKRYCYIGMERDDESGFYYIGARYYCPWLARWLAVDPINNEWYNQCKGQPQRNTERQFVEFTASGYEYCYANPVRFTDPNGEHHYDPNDPVWNYRNLNMYDITNAPSTGRKTGAGYPRNGPWAAKRYEMDAPEAMSPKNRGLIKQNKMPFVDEAWVKHTEARGTSQRAYMGDQLVHHHDNQGRMVTLVPKSFHENKANSPILHPVKNVKNYYAAGGKALGFFGIFADIISYKAGNPDSWVSMFSAPGEMPEVGKVYNDWGSARGGSKNRYFTVMSSTDVGDGQIKYEIDVFSSYKWSEKEKKYVGENKIGSQTTIRDYKNGGESSEIRDNKGKLIEYKDTRPINSWYSEWS